MRILHCHYSSLGLRLLLWLRFDPWSRNFYIPEAWPPYPPPKKNVKGKERKKKERKENKQKTQITKTVLLLLGYAGRNSQKPETSSF